MMTMVSTNIDAFAYVRLVISEIDAGRLDERPLLETSNSLHNA